MISENIVKMVVDDAVIKPVWAEEEFNCQYCILCKDKDYSPHTKYSLPIDCPLNDACDDILGCHNHHSMLHLKKSVEKYFAVDGGKDKLKRYMKKIPSDQSIVLCNFKIKRNIYPEFTHVIFNVFENDSLKGQSEKESLNSSCDLGEKCGRMGCFYKHSASELEEFMKEFLLMDEDKQDEECNFIPMFKKSKAI